MLDFLAAVALVVASLVVVAACLRTGLGGGSPLWDLLNRLVIAATVRRESSDLDRRYEELLRA